MAWTHQGSVRSKSQTGGGSIAARVDYPNGRRYLHEVLEACPMEVDLSLLAEGGVEDITSINAFFYGWRSLKHAPMLDTSGIMLLSSMFEGCVALESVPDYDFSSCIAINQMFDGCISLRAVPATLDTSTVMMIDRAFRDCLLLRSVPVIDMSSLAEPPEGVFEMCSSLESVEFANTGAAMSFRSLLLGCSALESVVGLDLAGAVEGDWRGGPLIDMLTGCASLQLLDIVNCSADISVAGTALDADELDRIFAEGLLEAEATITITGTPGAATCDRSIAEAKGWTVVA